MLTKRHKRLLNKEINKTNTLKCEKQVRNYFSGISSKKQDESRERFDSIINYVLRSKFGNRKTFTVDKQLLPNEQKYSELASLHDISPKIHYIDANRIIWDALEPIYNVDVFKLYDILLKGVEIGLYHKDPGFGSDPNNHNVMQDSGGKYYLIDWGEADFKESLDLYTDAADLLTDEWRRLFPTGSNLPAKLREYIFNKYDYLIPGLNVERRQLIKEEMRREQRERIEQRITGFYGRKNK